MYPAACDYYRAASLEEAVALLGEHSEARLLAGGHSLIPLMKLRLARPTALVDIGRLEELRGIDSSDGGVPATLPIWQEPWAITPRNQISHSGIPHFDIHLINYICIFICCFLS